MFEILGTATVLCTGKTDTLTENRMSLADLRAPAMHWRHIDATPPPDGLASLVEAAMLASAPQPSDPMERAIVELAGRPANSLTLVHRYGLGPKLLAMTNLWKQAGVTGCRVLSKGAPEAVATLCRRVAGRERGRPAAVSAPSSLLMVLAKSRAAVAAFRPARPRGAPPRPPAAMASSPSCSPSACAS